MGNRRRIKVGVDTLPIATGGGGAPDSAPYLLNGVDTTGDLTNPVNVLALAAPQSFIATSPIGGTVGVPVKLAYDNGPGSAGTAIAVLMELQSDSDNTVNGGSIKATLTDATNGAEVSTVTVTTLAAGSEEDALVIADSGLTLDGTGNKTITTATGDLIVSTTGGNFTAGSAGRVNNLSTFLASATTAAIASLKAEVNDGASPPVITDVKLDLSTAKTGEFTNVDTLAFSPSGATQTISTGDALDVVASKSIFIRSIGTVPNTNVAISATGNVVVAAGGSDRWAVVGTTGEFQSQGGAKITNVDPATAAGDVVVFEQILDAGVATPVDAGPAVAIVPGASFIATATFMAPNGSAGNFLLENTTGKTITLIGVRVLIPGATTTLSITVLNGATSLFSALALAGPGGGHLSCTANYSLANAAIANGASISISATGAAATVDTILFLEYIVQ